MKSGVEITEQGIRNDEIQGEAVIKLKELFPDCRSLTLRETGFKIREIINQILLKYNQKVLLEFPLCIDKYSTHSETFTYTYLT